jgi:two-component system sensor histidine kinase KdpD
VNVQHIESLNDVVAGITGVRMQETVPDAVFEKADEVVMIDTPPDELLERLKAGKVYIPEQARNAIENFFRKGNLIALREMALRTTADRVDAAMREYREGEGIRATWAAGERILVAIGPDEQGERLVRAGKRMAIGLHADWIVVYVETPELLRLSDEKRNQRIALLRLAESLGAEAVTLSGRSAGEALAEYARERNVTRIIIGRPRRPLWRRLFRPSTYGELLKGSEGMDIMVVGGADEPSALRNPVLARTRAYLGAAPAGTKKRWPGFAWGMAAAAACTAIGAWMSPLFELVNIAMVYLLAVVLIAVRHGRGPAVVTSILAVAAFDFFFVPPQLTFGVSDVQYLITFAIMLAVALITSNLTASVRLQANVAGHRERRTAALYAMTRQLAATRGPENMARVAVQHVSEVFDGQVVMLLPDANGKLQYPRSEGLSGSLHGADLAVAQWVQDHGEAAGIGTNTLPGTEALYLPLKGQSVLGVLGVLPANPRRVLLPEQFHLLETFAGQLAISLERAHLAERAQRAQVDAETEGLRNALLASISHDLRTPLAVISGASSSLAERGERLGAEERKALALSIFQHSREMGKLIGNVLEMTRLEAGSIALNRDWHAIGEIAGTLLRRMDEQLSAHPVEVDLPMDLPLVRIDAALIEQVLGNLIENAVKHTPHGTRIRLRVDKQEETLLVSVEDAGPGLPGGDPEQLFAKFHRGSSEGAVSGVGLGLAICRAIVRLHGGRIWAERRPEGGAAFRFTLPLEEAPQMPQEAATAER